MRDKAKIGIGLLAVVLVMVLPLAGKMIQKSSGGASIGNGTYILVSVDGHDISYSPFHEGRQAPNIISGSITLKRGGAFAAAMSFSNPVGGPVIRHFKGVYTKDGTTYILSWEGAGQTEAAIEGNKLTMNNEGMLFVYQK